MKYNPNPFNKRCKKGEVQILMVKYYRWNLDAN